MIIGIGTDLLDMRRIEKLLGRFEKRFIERCFTPAEIEKAESRRAGGAHIHTYAKRFAAKEACAKALGTGFAKGIGLKDIEVVNDENGQPYIHLYRAAQERLQSLTPQGKEAKIHLAVTDEPPFAQAWVIIEAL